MLLGGLATLLAGIGLLAIGVVSLALAAIAGGSAAADPRAAVAGGATYLLVGASLGSAGAGAMLGRAWAPPVLASLARIWLVTGTLGTLLLVLVVPGLLATGEHGLDLPREARLVAQALIFAVAVGGGIVVPALVLVSTRASGAPAGRRSAWSEQCPRPVLTLALALGASAVLALPALARPVVPVAHVVLTGPIAVLLTLAGAGLAAWLGWSVYRLERRGLVGAAVATAACGASLVASILTLDAAALASMLGVSRTDAAWLQSAAPIGRRTVAAAALGATLASLTWLGSLWRYFPRRDARSSVAG